MADNVVEVGDFSIARKGRIDRYDRQKCRHLRVELNDHGETVICSDCGVQLSAYWALSMVAERMSAEWSKSPAIVVDDDGLTFVRCQPGSGCKGTGLISFWETEKSDTAIGAWNCRALPVDQVLVPRELLEDIEMTWRIFDKNSKPLNELGEQKIKDGLSKVRALLQR
ncbi:hypothetical protein [Pseudomonas aeruginosa]|uniref:hypothetical protein n=1 Tax=Pseudomonas aeruginosa TaxID=287 RepID=UPI000BB55CD8|nr:hypothetical protein [Pseudomonas aeruginosa]PBN23825.1 hypothetical protein B8B65_28820 [Pseudomonas aeruginosa]